MPPKLTYPLIGLFLAAAVDLLINLLAAAVQQRAFADQFSAQSLWLLAGLALLGLLLGYWLAARPQRPGIEASDDPRTPKSRIEANRAASEAIIQAGKDLRAADVGEAFTTDRAPRKPYLRLDAAVPEAVQLNRAFTLAAVIKRPDSPKLKEEDRPHVKSGHLQPEWPADDDYIRLKIQVDAPDCDLSGPDSETIRLYRDQDSEPFYFNLTPLKIGTINIIVKVYQEADLLGNARVKTIAQDEVIGQVEIAITSHPFFPAPISQSRQVSLTEMIMTAQTLTPAPESSRQAFTAAGLAEQAYTLTPQPQGEVPMEKFLARISGKIKIEAAFAIIFAVIFISVILTLAIAFPKPTPFQEFVFRVILSLSAAATVGAIIPGFISVDMSFGPKFALSAGGAIATFVLIYVLNPPQLVQPTEPSPTNTPAPATFAPAGPDETLVVVIEFEDRSRGSLPPGIDPSSIIFDFILEASQDTTVRVERYPKPVTTPQEAKKISDQFDANLVIWGWYNTLRIQPYIELGQRTLLDASVDITTPTPVAFFFLEQALTKAAYLGFYSLGLTHVIIDSTTELQQAIGFFDAALEVVEGSMALS